MLLNRVPVIPGLQTPTFDLMKAQCKSLRNPKDKYCVLLFDEMAITPELSYNAAEDYIEGFEDFGYRSTDRLANHVQVVMLRGIHRGWKQPVYFNFVQGATKMDDICRILKMVIQQSHASGLRVVATVCDQGTNNVAAINAMIKKTKDGCVKDGKRLDEDIFEVDGQTVVPLFDCPHLLKGIRNNLIKWDLLFKYEGQEWRAKREHIYNAYKLDPYLGSLRTMPKLTEEHVNPEKIRKMKVAYCTQVRGDF